MKSLYRLRRVIIIGKAHLIDENGVEYSIDVANAFDCCFDEEIRNFKLISTHENCFVFDRCPLRTEVSRGRMFK